MEILYSVRLYCFKSLWHRAFNPYTELCLGPTVDDNLIPALPGVSYLKGNYSSHLNVMVGHNANEVSRR